MKTINFIPIFLIAFLLTTASISSATRPDPPKPDKAPEKPKDKTQDHSTKSGGNNKNKGGGGGGGNEGGSGGFNFPPGFNIPGFGDVPGGYGNVPGGGYGYGYGGPKGKSGNGVVRPTVVCKDKGPCKGKKLTCPAKCFSSYSHSGKNGGSGGGGGGCTMDCKKKCVAYC